MFRQILAAVVFVCAIGLGVHPSAQADASCSSECESMCAGSAAGDDGPGCLALCMRTCGLERMADLCTPEGYACIVNGTPCCGGGSCEGTFPNTFCVGGADDAAGSSPDGASCYEDRECSGGACEGGSCCTAPGNACDQTSHCCGYQACGADGYCP